MPQRTLKQSINIFFVVILCVTEAATGPLEKGRGPQDVHYWHRRFSLSYNLQFSLQLNEMNRPLVICCIILTKYLLACKISSRKNSGCHINQSLIPNTQISTSILIIKHQDTAIHSFSTKKHTLNKLQEENIELNSSVTTQPLT